MAFQVTNRKACQALRGQDVIVTLDSSETINKLPNVAVGATVTLASTGNVGYVSFVDSKGCSFRVRPKSPVFTMESIAPGYLSVSETVTIS